MHRLIALLGVFALALGSSGCFLWAFHEAKKGQERHEKEMAGHQANMDKCKATVQERAAQVPDAPPAAPIDGTWQCLYTSPTGDQFAESLSFSTSGRSIAVTGRDNFNGNIIADGQVGGNALAFQHNEAAVVNLTMHPSGRTLDGQVMYWYMDGLTCYETKYRCRRRY